MSLNAGTAIEYFVQEKKYNISITIKKPFAGILAAHSLIVLSKAMVKKHTCKSTIFSVSLSGELFTFDLWFCRY